jgi:hypothetical protein
MKKLIILFIAVAGFSVGSFGQAVSPAAKASASIITPISISKSIDMSFGNIAAGTGGTVVLLPAGTRTATGNVKLTNIAGTVTAAKFVVTGNGASTYTISLPTSIELTRKTGTEKMTVNAFSSTPTVTLGGTLTAGTQDLLVGATLIVTSGQVVGDYENTTDLTVTVNYN